MNPLRIRNVASLLLAFTFANVLDAKETRPPNFVLIFTDDQGYEDVGCFGSQQIRTPRLDQMAKEGMRFTSFYAQPICGPSRAALMTGCYPLRVAERGNIKYLHPVLHSKEITIAEVLKKKGYATACFGKWDLAGHAQKGFRRDLMPNHQGFDYFFGTPTSNDSVVNLYRNDKLIEPKADMSLLTRRYTDEAIRFMRENKNGPFFAYLPYTMPHTRLAASKEFKGNSKRGLYGDVIEEIDHNIGRLFDALKELDLVGNTYVLFMSDNGPWLIKNKDYRDGALPGDHGGSAGPLRGGKVSTWEGGVRVPMIVRAPGRIPAGSVCDSLASTLDLLPTLAALAGVQTPTDRVIDGEDIRHLLEGRFDKANPNKAHYYYFHTHLQAVRQGKWKLHLPRSNEPERYAPLAGNRSIAPVDRMNFEKPFLIDLEEDLDETTNVAEQHPDIVKQLLTVAEAARHDIGDYDRVGVNMRFFDPLAQRPTKPPILRPRRRKSSASKGKQRTGANVKTWAKFEELPVGAIRPEGWLLRGLELQRDGFMGHLEEIGFPFDSDAWLTRNPIGPDPRVARRHRGWTERWNWHISANWLEATLRNGYLLDDKTLIEKVRKRISYNLQHQDPDGALGPRRLNGKDRVVRPTPTEFLHVLATEYSATGDAKIVEALKKYFRNGMRDGRERSGGNSAGGGAEDYQIAIVLWLYAQTGDESYLKYAKTAFARNGEGKLAELLSDTRNEGHAYFWLVGKTIPVLMHKYTGERKYLDAVVNGYRKLDRDQMLFGGAPSSSEFLRTNTALDAMEACNATNYPVGLKFLLQATGDVAYADKIEKAIFNFLPGVMTSDFKAYQYHSSPNQVVATGESNHAERSRDIHNHAKGSPQLMAFRPIHTCPCCAANIPRALPNFISWMFQRGSDGALTAVLYGPSHVTTSVGKTHQKITITERTDYPFSDKINFTIRTDEPVQFDFRLRIPGWCKRPQVLVNGAPIGVRVTTGEYAKISRTFKNDDKITLILPMEIQLSHWPRGGVGIERGPLAYALRIEEDWRKRPKILGMIDAKELNSTKDFPGWDLHAASPWNYALAVDEKNLADVIQVVRRRMNSEPWSIANAPIELLVPARRVSDWKIGENGLTPQLPAPATLKERLSGEVKTVRLVPFGCAKLRISVFPQCNSRGQ